MAGVTPPRYGALEELLAHLGPTANLDAYAQRHLEPIADYDRDRGTRLLPTLAAFLDSGGNLEAAASRLGAHRNTVRYRMRSIAALINRDIHDPSVSLELHLALRIRVMRGWLPATQTVEAPRPDENWRDVVVG